MLVLNAEGKLTTDLIFSIQKAMWNTRTGSTMPSLSKTYSRPDDSKRHVRKFQSEAAKRNAEDSAELAHLELFHSNKVPKLETDESQTGGAVSTRSMSKTKKRWT